MNLTKGWRMAGFPVDPRNNPAEPNPHLVIMGYFAIALMTTLFSVFLLGKFFGKKNVEANTEEIKED
jgi:hypothetical protein